MILRCPKFNKLWSPWRWRFLALVLVLFAASATVAAQQVPAGLDIDSVRILGIDRARGIVQYLALHLVPAQPRSGAGLLRLVEIGDSVVASGVLSFGLTSADRDRLERWTHARVGPSAKLESVGPKEFAIRVWAGSTLLWERPLAAGSPRQIPIQVSHRNGAALNLVAEVLVVWEEAGPRVSGTWSVNWAHVLQSLRSKTDANGVILERDVEDICSLALTQQWIRWDEATSDDEHSTGASAVLKRLLMHSTLNLVTDERTALRTETMDRRFALRRDVTVETLTSTVEVTTSVGPVERSRVFKQKLNP